MKQIWNYISYLGLDNKSHDLNQKTTVLCNQLNFIMLVTMVLLFIILRINGLVEHTRISISSLRIFLLFLVNLANLVAARYGHLRLSKLSFIFLPPVVFILFPTLVGFVEEESFTYYPYILIALSIIPQLTLIPVKDRFVYRLSLIYYFALLVSIDFLLIAFMPERFIIVDRIESFFVFYKIAHVGIFLFVYFAVYYLRVLNVKFEDELKAKNATLDLQNEELRNTLEHLKITEQQLIQSEKMSALGSLTAGVAHEINNPLNFISGGLYLVDEVCKNSPDLPANELMQKLKIGTDIMRSGVGKASSIVQALMTFSNRYQSALVKTNIHDLIDNTLGFMQSKLGSGIRVEKNYRLTDECPVYRDKFHQIVWSILENAIFALKDSPEPRIIAISTYPGEDHNGKNAIIKISNSGAPIPFEIMGKIFDPFFTTKDPGEGTGLGLSIAYSFAKEHKGSIMAENSDPGVSFIIKIPLLVSA